MRLRGEALDSSLVAMGVCVQDKGKGLSRRDFIIRSVAGVGLAAVVASPLTVFLKRAKAADSASPVTSNGEKTRQWCMVIDLKRCDGCTGLDLPPQCTQTCTAMHYIPKGQQWIQVFEDELAGGGSYFRPAPCMQCENAPCVNVCPVAATYQIPEGITLVDQRRCIGCRMCMAACPYQRRFFNWGKPELPPEVAAIPYSPEFPVGGIRGTVAKCTFCVQLLRVGKPPVCVSACPRKVLYMGDLTEDIASNGKEVVKLSRFLAENNAYHLKEELGTQPRVWYLPGHGEAVGRDVFDPRDRMPSTWTWGGDGNDRRIGVWPWRNKQ